MAFTTNNLTAGGQTAHYRFQYDTTLAGGLEPARTNAVLAACEGIEHGSPFAHRSSLNWPKARP